MQQIIIWRVRWKLFQNQDWKERLFEKEASAKMFINALIEAHKTLGASGWAEEPRHSAVNLFTE